MRAHVLEQARSYELARACARSVDVPGHVPSVATFTVRSMAAAMAWKAHNEVFARRELAALGDVFVESTWGQISPRPREQFDKLRQTDPRGEERTRGARPRAFRGGRQRGRGCGR